MNGNSSLQLTETINKDLALLKGGTKSVESFFPDVGKLTFDEHVDALERYWKGDISYTFTKP